MVRFRRILCPVDFLPASLQAFDYALKLAANHGGRVQVLHVVAPVIAAAYGETLNVAPVTADLEKQAQHMLRPLQFKARKASIPIETEVRRGVVDLEIQKAIDRNGADVAVMGTHGRRGFERWLMGSVTERLIRTCPVPLFTIGSARKTRGSPLAIPRILVTTDFSDGTTDAVQYAFSIAKECQAKITLLHVVNDGTAPLGGKLTERLILNIRRKLQDLSSAGGPDADGVRTLVETGEPYRVILETIASYKPGLVIMNIHGKDRVERALIGTTAERVVRGAVNVCPVLLIPPARPIRRKKTTNSRTAA